MDRQAYHYCRLKTRHSGSSFTRVFFLLPRPQREAMTALYAFCREVDDCVDDAINHATAHAEIAEWRREIEQLYAHCPTHPVTRALLPAVQRYGLPKEDFEALIDGMAMDLLMDEEGRRYAALRELGLYCHRVAGVVGLLSARIFGYQDPHTLKYAARLGLALQLTNILRDVGEDAARGRIYLPQDELAQFGVSEESLLTRTPNGDFIGLMQWQYDRAQQTYAEALALLPAVDRRAQRPGLIMAALYQHTLKEIRRAGFPVLQRRVSLPAWRKLGIAVRVGWGLDAL
ncbi:MAG: squalene synthase HpnD [Betaproteobacteria bacterium]|nr:MAG: squalene synthase HpnD [Betaproteobacteria bacterium]